MPTNSSDPRGMLRMDFDQHVMILTAMRQRNAPWAEALMRAHILGGLQALSLSERPDQDANQATAPSR